MSDSMLGKFIRAIRIKYDISDIKIAYRLGISVKKYLTLESHPEKASPEELDKLFLCIGMTNEEIEEFFKYRQFYERKTKKGLKLAKNS
ncbi:hypothetical protein N9W41_00070 [bacterium]|nr:hypothetical protein [bacterium]